MIRPSYTSTLTFEWLEAIGTYPSPINANTVETCCEERTFVERNDLAKDAGLIDLVEETIPRTPP
jgi:hypothetical protein